MAERLLQLLSLLLLVLMPIGMTAAPASAHSAPAAMADHCAGAKQESPDMGDQRMDCAICSALPAAQLPQPADLDLPAPVLALGLARAFVGVEPDTATPPPRRA